MNITRMTVWQVPLTSHLAYNMADGKICDTVVTSVLRLEADNGLSGWGKVCPIPHYLPAYAGGVAPALNELAPVVFAGDGLALGAEAMMQAATGLAMKIDENAHDTASLLKAWQLGCMDAVALKLSKFGGLGALRRARDLCLSLGAKMCIEDTWGSDIVTAAALHLGAATP